jgi:hypothetical protein
MLRKNSACALLSLCALLWSLPPALSEIQEKWITDPKGKNIFKLRFFNKYDDGAYGIMNMTLFRSTGPFSKEEQESIKQGFAYWAHVISPPSSLDKEHTIINLGKSQENRTFGAGGIFTNLIAPKKESGYQPEAHTYISVGNTKWSNSARFSQLLEGNGDTFDLMPMIIHEFSHALYTSHPLTTQHFASSLNTYESYLRDKKDRSSKPNMKICSPVGSDRLKCQGGNDEFDASSVTFQGPEVKKVLKGHFPQSGIVNQERTDILSAQKDLTLIPLKGLPIKDDLDHLELRNSLMSHQLFRNYSMYMEAELAMLQDVGYLINRRNHFGYSVYQDYREIENSRPFFAHNGTAYDKSKPNTSPLGVGLHIYGSYNKVTQKADISTQGPGASGIRVDGMVNTVIIPKDTKVYADGPQGRALMVSYGSNHTIVHQGDLKASGTGGIGASFDFGKSLLNQDPIHVNSYYKPSKDDQVMPLVYVHYLEPHLVSHQKFLNGPLVANVNITGHLEGQRAAIYISDNAHVQNINVMAGADIVGPILSNYKASDTSGKPRLTRLTFGRKAHTLGIATDALDPDFSLSYTGSLSGKDSFFPIFYGGTTKWLGGHHDIFALTIKEGATVHAHGKIVLSKGLLSNAGTLVAGDPNATDPYTTLMIEGSYTQDSSGALAVLFKNDAATGFKTTLLDISGKATLGGTLYLYPSGFFPENWQSPKPFLSATSIEGTFSDVLSMSPTLTFFAFRNDDPYQRHYHLKREKDKNPSDPNPKPLGNQERVHLPLQMNQCRRERDRDGSTQEGPCTHGVRSIPIRTNKGNKADGGHVVFSLDIPQPDPLRLSGATVVPLDDFRRNTLQNAFWYLARVLQKSSLDQTSLPAPTVVHLVPNKSSGFGEMRSTKGFLTSLRRKEDLSWDKPTLNADGAHMTLDLPLLGFAWDQGSFSSLVPTRTQPDLFSTVVHEVAHGLFKTDMISDAGTLNTAFPTTLNGFDRHVYDANGRQASAGLSIKHAANPNGTFDISHMTFQGPTTRAVLTGQFGAKGSNKERVGFTKESADLTGIPLYKTVDKDFAHLALRNTLTSPHSFRNYSMFTAAELAALVDMGYTIDIGNFFGYSVYQNYREIENETPFCMRNATGTDYECSVFMPPDPNGSRLRTAAYNTSPLGIGLHIYGSYNTVTQKADILTQGAGSAGIRIDGVKNTVILPAGTDIDIQGENGRGLMVTYGKDHSITLHQRASIMAWGRGGIGASFDFGGSTLGNTQGTEVRSYGHDGTRDGREGASAGPSFVDGPLVSNFNVMGKLQGSEAALYIGKSAHVNAINFMRGLYTSGPTVTGSIISDYNEFDASGHIRRTYVNFGNKPDPSRNPSHEPDPWFNMFYRGSIKGKENLHLVFVGGTTSLDGGSHEVLTALVKKDATLNVTGKMTVSSTGDGWFYNEGTVMSGNPFSNIYGKLEIFGDYGHGESGILKIFFSKTQISSLDIHGNAALNGTLSLNPREEFFPDDWYFPQPFLSADTVKGSFKKIEVNSPTLEANSQEFDTAQVKSNDRIHLFVKRKGAFLPPETNDQLCTTEDCMSPSETGPENHSPKEDTQKPPKEKFHDELKRFALDRSYNEDADFPNDPENVLAQEIGKIGEIEENGEGKGESSPSHDDAIGFGRPLHAYSQYGSDDNGQAVGYFLRNLVRQVPDGTHPLAPLYVALDFSARDGSEIRSTLGQMAPHAYSAVVATSVIREQQISDTLTSLPLSSSKGALIPTWQIFAMPFGGSDLQKATDNDQVGYSASQRGLVFGAERYTHSYFVWGFHGLVTQSTMDIKTEDRANTKMTGGSVGLHGRYGKADAGLYLMGQARIGFQSSAMTRNLQIGTYGGQIRGTWTGLNATTVVNGGYMWKVGSHLSVGPVGELVYTTVSSPTITETSLLPTALRLKPTTFHALGGRLGVKTRITLGEKLAAEVQFSLDRDLLGTFLVQDACFVDYATKGFSTKNRILQRNMATLQAQATYIVNTQFTVGARISQTFRPDLTASLGQLTALWRF